MRVIGAMLLAGSFLVGCATDPTAGSSARGNDNGTLSEPIYYKDQLCTINFYGTNSPDAQTFFIWNLGVGSWLQDATYPTDARPDLYAVFAPAPADATHHVDGYDQFDHYHITSSGPGEAGYDTTWDVWLVFPGPNFNAATYQAATSYDAFQAQVASGVLGQPIKTTDAGFQPLVLRTAIGDCH